MKSSRVQRQCKFVGRAVQRGVTLSNKNRGKALRDALTKAQHSSSRSSVYTELLCFLADTSFSTHVPAASHTLAPYLFLILLGRR